MSVVYATLSDDGKMHADVQIINFVLLAIAERGGLLSVSVCVCVGACACYFVLSTRLLNLLRYNCEIFIGARYGQKLGRIRNDCIAF